MAKDRAKMSSDAKNNVVTGGGAAGTRGYLVQVLVALLDSLMSDAFGDWEFLTMELPGHDKVDIHWEMKDRSTKVVQVKSSINPISKGDVEGWADQLIENYKSASKYEAVSYTHLTLPTKA